MSTQWCVPTDLTPDEQPQPLSEVNEGKGDAGMGANTRMEVNCNGHTAASAQQSESNVEAQGAEHSTAAVEKEQEEEEEEKQQQQQLQQLEDQQNANQPDSSSEAREALSNDTEHQTCNGSAQDVHLQAPPTAVSPDSVTVEIKEGEEVGEAPDEQMLSGGDSKREDKEKGNQDNQLNLFSPPKPLSPLSAKL